MGRVRSPKRRVRDDDFIVGCVRIILGLSSNRLSIGGSIQGVSAEILSFKISWQAQYLVRLEGDFTCSTHWKWGFICDADHWWHSFCVAGAVFGEVGCWLYLLRALEMTFLMWCGSSMTLILCGRRSIWWGWMLTVLAPRIGNDVSYVMRIVDDIDFVWQAQHLVRLDADCTCSAHWKWRCICDADRRWHWFCVAGVVFGEVGGWLFVTGAALRDLDILGDSRSANRCILQYKGVSKMGSRKVPEAAGARWRFYRRISSDYRRIIVGLWSNRLSIGGSASGSFRWNLELQDFVAGAVFGEVGGWL